MRRRKTVLIVAVIAVALLFVLSPVYSYWESLPQISYKIGDEIKGFPIDEVSITVWNYSVTNANVQGLPLPSDPSGLQWVILNVSIHNLVNKDIFFNQTGDLQTKLSKASSKYLFLELDGEHTFGIGGAISAGGASYPRTPNEDTNWWGVALDVSSFTELRANQRVDGFMYFLKDQGLIPKELICKSHFETKPIFAVDLQQP
jgi:hypothetical protein